MAERRLRGQPSLLEFGCNVSEALRTGLISSLFRESAREGGEEAKPVLKISELDVVEQPGPVQMRISSENPGKGPRDTRVEVVLRERLQDEDGGIQGRTRAEV